MGEANHKVGVVIEQLQCVEGMLLHCVCACVRALWGVFAQNNRGLLQPADIVMKYLQNQTKHFLYDAGSTHRWLSEHRSSLARLSLTWAGTDYTAECHPSSSRWHVTKTRTVSVENGIGILPWRLSNAPSWSIQHLKLSLREMIATSKQSFFFDCIHDCALPLQFMWLITRLPCVCVNVHLLISTPYTIKCVASAWAALSNRSFFISLLSYLIVLSGNLHNSTVPFIIVKHRCN